MEFANKVYLVGVGLLVLIAAMFLVLLPVKLIPKEFISAKVELDGWDVVVSEAEVLSRLSMLNALEDGRYLKASVGRARKVIIYVVEDVDNPSLVSNKDTDSGPVEFMASKSELEDEVLKIWIVPRQALLGDNFVQYGYSERRSPDQIRNMFLNHHVLYHMVWASAVANSRVASPKDVDKEIDRIIADYYNNDSKNWPVFLEKHSG